jgi:hypothetical protein
LLEKPSKGMIAESDFWFVDKKVLIWFERKSADLLKGKSSGTKQEL